MKNKYIEKAANELAISKKQIQQVINLLNEGNTVPFIARYRKEQTGALTGQKIREIEKKHEYYKKLLNHKEKISKLLSEQGKLDSELKQKIKRTDSIQKLKDIYRPYRKKRKTRADKARQKGLKPLAQLIWQQKINKEKDEIKIKDYIDQDIFNESEEKLFQGARDIIAEWISSDIEIREITRNFFKKTGTVVTKKRENDNQNSDRYQMYYDYREKISKIPPHRILAINRGEKEEVLSVYIRVSGEEIINKIQKKIITGNSFFKKQLCLAVEEAYKRLLAPSMVREMRRMLTERAKKQAQNIFAANLRDLLLQPPVRDKIVLGLDPGFKSGTKAAVVNKRGIYQESEVLYPHPPHRRKEDAYQKVVQLINEYEVGILALGNGTASRETEKFIADLIKKENLSLTYTIINEAGASYYSTSEAGIREFPNLDPGIRSAISLARRLQDPLAELVKIEPAHLGIGLYQHDIKGRALKELLEKITVDVVNQIGVNLNSASFFLLQYVAGINTSTAENIIEYREKNEGFDFIKNLKQVYGVGPKTYKQAAGFLKIFSPEDPLAATLIHPENYSTAHELLAQLGFSVEDIHTEHKKKELKNSINSFSIKELAHNLDIGLPTLKDIIECLLEPQRDPREERTKPLFRKDILKIDDLQPGMVLRGRVVNVVDFGAFVDIGLKQEGLVHISNISDDYINHPLEELSIGQTVSVKVISIEKNRSRVGLSIQK